MSDEGAWEQLTALGRELIAEHDRRRWDLGALALQVASVYGQASLRNYAADINCRASTLYEYRRVREMFSDDERDSLPLLTWSHFRAALKLEHDAAIEALQRANDNDMRADEFRDYVRILCNEEPPARALFVAEGYVVGYDGDANTVTVSVDVLAALGDWREAQEMQWPVKIHVYEHTEVAADESV